MSMARLCRLFAFAFLFLTAAGGAQAGDIVVDEVVVSLTPSGSGGAFMAIVNKGDEDDTLLGASSPAAKKVQLHSTKEVDGVMKMRKVKSVPVPAGSTVMLARGGLHVMLFGVSKDMQTGDSIDLVLDFEKAGEVPITATLAPPTAMPAGHSEDMNHENMDHGNMEDGNMDHGTMAAAGAGEAMPMPMMPLEVTINRISAEGVGEAIGTLTLTAQDGGVLLTPSLSGLEPGPHAFHVHKKPNCGPAEKDGQMVAGLAAGGHFDPAHKGKKAKGSKKAKDDKKAKDNSKKAKDQLTDGGQEMPAPADAAAAGHGGHMHKPAGDLPELTVDAAGNAQEPIEITSLNLKQMMGRSIMIHAYGENPAEADKPKGGGARIACGVVPKHKQK